MLPENFPELPKAEKQRLVDKAAEEILADRKYLKGHTLRMKRYGLSPESMPERLREQIVRFIEYKTEPTHVLGIRGVIRRPLSDRPINKQTIRSWQQFFRQFFGWCVLESTEAYEARTGHQPDRDAQQLLGAGMHPNELTLGLLAVPHIVHEYLKWRFSIRTNGDNHSTVNVLGQISSLNHPKTGYLTKMPELIRQVPPRHLKQYKEGFLAQLDKLEGGLSIKIAQERAALVQTFDEDTSMEDE